MRRVVLLAVFFATAALAAPPFESSKPPYISNSGVARGVIVAPDFKPVAGDVYIYVDAVNGLDTNPGTVGAPLQTLPVAVAKLPTLYSGQCRIQLAAGTYSTTGLTIRPGIPLGQAAPFVLQGTMADSGLGTRIVSSITKSGSYAVTITDNTLSITASQYEGYFIRMTSGAANGLRRMVRDNTVGGGFDLNESDLGTNPAPGDTFVIEAPASIVSSSGTLILDSAANRDAIGMVVSQVRFVQTGSGQIEIATNVKANTVQISMPANHIVTLRYGSSLQGGGYDSGLSAAVGISDVITINNYGCGVFVTHPSGPYVFSLNSGYGHGATLQGHFSIRNGAILLGAGTVASLLAFDCKGGNSYCLAADGGSVWDHGFGIGQKGRLTNTSATTPVIKMNGSVARLVDHLDISNCGYTAITLQQGSSMYAHGDITGTGCVGYGLAVESGSTVLVSGVNTLTGTLGELEATGDTTVTGTWASVLAGTPIVQAVAGQITRNYGP